jgi:hypothetical protein
MLKVCEVAFVVVLVVFAFFVGDTVHVRRPNGACGKIRGGMRRESWSINVSHRE